MNDVGLFSGKPTVPEDYVPTRAPSSAIYSEAKDRKWLVEDLAAMDDLIAAEVPESEGVIAILLYTRGQLLVLTPGRLLLFSQSVFSNKARLEKGAPLSEIRDASVVRLSGPVRISIDGPAKLNHIQYTSGEIEPAREFVDEVLAARDRLLGPRSIEPVPTRLDMAWFRVWMTTTISDAGGDPANAAHVTSLLETAGKSTWALGDELMDTYGGAWAKPLLRDYMESEAATPWGACEFIAGWNPDSVDPLERNLVSLGEIAAEVRPFH